MSDRDPLEASFDRFTRPGDIPDTAYWRPGDTLADAQARRDAARAADAAERGYAVSHPAGRGWAPGRGDRVPVEHVTTRAPGAVVIDGETHEFPHGIPDDVIAAIGAGAKFDRERRVRFLDLLSLKGNVRAAAARVGVSHETAYRARRQDPGFAALWDTALLHARKYAESELATHALDGVEVAVWNKGEIVGYVVKFDARLRLAHLARLDRLAEADTAEARAAQARAPHFDALLAEYAGHAAPDGFSEAAGLGDEDRDEHADDATRIPTRCEYVAWFAAAALEGVAEAVEEEAWAAAVAQAEAAYDAWHEQALAAVERIVAGEDYGEGEEPPVEVKSAPPRAGEGDHPQGGGGEPTNARDVRGSDQPHVPHHPRPAAGGSPPRTGEAPAPAPTPRHAALSNPVTSVTSPATPALRPDEPHPRAVAPPQLRHASPHGSETAAAAAVAGPARWRRPTFPPVQTGATSSHPRRATCIPC
jgi:hypothetical protein